MPYTLNQATTAASTIDAQGYSINKSVSYTVTSSNAIQQTVASITSSVWTQLSLGSLTDVRYLSVYNDNTTTSASFMSIATGSAGQNLLAVVPSGVATAIWWSGSLGGLYAKITGGTDINGTLQYYAQQS